MRKYYLEIEGYKNEPGILSIRVINQATKNRRVKFAKNLGIVKLDFLEIGQGIHERTSLYQDLAIASTKIMNLISIELYKKK